MTKTRFPRVVVAGLSGDAGKSLVSLGLIRAIRKLGRAVAPFKKGPDFIDAAWLGAAAGLPGRNLDTFLMPRKAITNSVERASHSAEIAVVEGNRGLFDGMDPRGSHSTAVLAKLIDAPVVLVVDATKTTRTVAALVLGCLKMDPAVRIGGVVLNRVATRRQEGVIREAVERETGIEILGAVPKLDKQHLPSRHLGLVTAMEHPDVEESLSRVGEAVERYVDVNGVVELASSAGQMDSGGPPAEGLPAKTTVRVGVLKDKAFSFYYEENLESLKAAGAELVFISPLEDKELPQIDILYAGGGFPEVYAGELSRNEPFREALAERIDEGLPVWAECGGLMYLSEALTRKDETYPMVGALPVVVEQMARPQGHGYVRARVDAENPFFGKGTELKGHEFHYSRIRGEVETVPTAMAVERGTGIGGARDGILKGRVLATYTHLHALGEPRWAKSLLNAASGVAQ